MPSDLPYNYFADIEKFSKNLRQCLIKITKFGRLLVSRQPANHLEIQYYLKYIFAWDRESQQSHDKYISVMNDWHMKRLRPLPIGSEDKVSFAQILYCCDQCSYSGGTQHHAVTNWLRGIAKFCKETPFDIDVYRQALTQTMHPPAQDAMSLDESIYSEFQDLMACQLETN